MLDEQDRVKGYEKGLAASEGAQGNLTLGADQNINILSEAVDGDKYWDLDGTISGESTQRDAVKRRL